VYPNGSSKILKPTAPLIGVFDDQHHLFKQAFLSLPPGTLFVGATDGVTEARSESRELFGMDRFVEAAVEFREQPEAEILRSIMDKVEAFSSGKYRDDIAITAVRFL
jgi:serine phosphatase RsbU (regulator of sigma subunit)